MHQISGVANTRPHTEILTVFRQKKNHKNSTTPLTYSESLQVMTVGNCYKTNKKCQ